MLVSFVRLDETKMGIGTTSYGLTDSLKERKTCKAKICVHLNTKLEEQQ